MPFSILPFAGSIEIPHEITDMELMNLDYDFQKDQDAFSAILAFTCEIPDSYSNLLLLFRLTVYPTPGTIRIGYLDIVSANSIQRDTFKVTKMLPIHQSNLLVLIEEDYGALVFNVSEILRK